MIIRREKSKRRTFIASSEKPRYKETKIVTKNIYVEKMYSTSIEAKNSESIVWLV